jgi:hypothetical protein
MARWFISSRAQSVGGPIGPVKVLDAERPGYAGDLTGEFIEAIRGREVFFAAHGFNVDQKNGAANLGYWFDTLQIGNAIPVGILWPGDCIVPIFVDYVVEGREAIQSGTAIAQFLNKNATGAASLCFASHSLGARVVLQTIAGLAAGFRIRRTLIMAGAIDDDCLTNEYGAAASRIDEISILASAKDDVLAMAYPLGNPIQGIIDRGHPYWHAALGRGGPATPYPPSPKLKPNWEIPGNLNYGHLDYLPGSQIPAPFTIPVDIPPDTGRVPPDGAPAELDDPKSKWKPAWSAGFASNRFK